MGNKFPFEKQKFNPTQPSVLLSRKWVDPFSSWVQKDLPGPIFFLWVKVGYEFGSNFAGLAFCIVHSHYYINV
jgi:hypothetical protein